LAPELPSPPPPQSYLLPAATVALTIGIFVVDTATPPEIRCSVLYVIVILMADRFCQQRGLLMVGLGCVALSLISQFLSPGDPWSIISVSNALADLAALGATTFLVLRTKRTEESLWRSQTEVERVTRVATLGEQELTAAIAHQINQPLTGVVSSANACLRWLANEPPNVEAARRSVERIINDGKRAGEVISRIRALARNAPALRVWLNINDLIRESLALVRPEIQENRIWLRTGLSEDLPHISGDRVQLQQVILNLLTNAIEAMSGPDQVQRELSIISAKDGPNGVLVAVQDSGKGLDETALMRLFDAFYTTKPEGMGMGLAICRTIIEAHDGELSAMPNAPRGAKFEFRLPGGVQEAA
jgi:C4-dicarboxylate-specific signal transduction histidine kinase